MLDAVEEVDKENQHRKRDDKTGNRQQEMRGIKSKRRVVIHNAAAHTPEPDHHHTHGQHKERGRHQPEVDLAPEFIHAPAGSLREPVIDGGEEWEDKPTKNRIVKVTDNPVGVMKMQIQ